MDGFREGTFWLGWSTVGSLMVSSCWVWFVGEGDR